VGHLRAGIIGYGLAGQAFHARLIASTSGLAVSAIVTANPGRADAARREHSGARVVASAEEMLDLDLDVVVVASPNHTHAELARQAMARGRAVVVDKPMAGDAEEAQGLVDLAAERGCLLTVFHNRRWDSDHLTLQRLISAGDLGDVLRYESRFERWRPELGPDAKEWRDLAGARAGGVRLDLGPHLVDQALELFGPPEDLHAEMRAVRGGADDDLFVALRHGSGVVSHLWASAVAAAPGPRLRVLGTKGAYVVEEVDGQEEALRAGRRPGEGGPWGEEPPERWGHLVRGDEREPVRSEPGRWPEFYARLERAFRDEGPPPVDPRDAVAGLRVLDAARAAAAP
jgi:scyllo-inositol 2-dehydrogenase (NADP+)